MPKKICISVIGSGSGDDALKSAKSLKLRMKLEEKLQSRGAVLICGGLGGVMTEAAKGAKENGGLTVGILPGEDPGSANSFIDITLPTGLGFARNAF